MGSLVRPQGWPRESARSARRSTRWSNQDGGKSRPLRRSRARLAITPPASDSRDHAGRSSARAVVPAPSGRFGVVPCVATRRQRLRATRARHLFAWECPSSGTADRNPARTRPRDPKGPHPLVTKPEGHFHFSWTKPMKHQTATELYWYDGIRTSTGPIG